LTEGVTILDARAGHVNFTALRELTREDIAHITADQPIIEVAPVEFACAAIPVPPPTNSIYALKPGHIKVVMAMGDSISAAMSAKDTNVLNLKEYRGISFSAGGDNGVTTMPNILKQFTASGFPLGPSTGIGKRDSAGTGYNAAESGDINSDMLQQAQWLVGKLKADTKISIKEDWKVLSIWIGSNNICDVCDNNVNNNADDFEKNVMIALDYLHTNVPRLFVNLIANLDITQIYDIKAGTCALLHPVECACVASSDANVRALVKKINLEYQTRATKIANYYASLKDDEFAVVRQPFLTKTLVNERSLLSAADCFHPSAISHQYAGVALWNNMITPEASKKTNWDPKEQVICATENTLIYTN